MVCEAEKPCTMVTGLADVFAVDDPAHEDFGDVQAVVETLLHLRRQVFSCTLFPLSRIWREKKKTNRQSWGLYFARRTLIHDHPKGMKRIILTP